RVPIGIRGPLFSSAGGARAGSPRSALGRIRLDRHPGPARDPPACPPRSAAASAAPAPALDTRRGSVIANNATRIAVPRMRSVAQPTSKIGSPGYDRPPAPSPALRKLVDRAYRGRERVIRDIVARCRQVPCYRALSGPGLEALYRTVGHLATGFYRRSI